MATVNGYTKEHMDEIVDDNIIDGNVVSGDLILVTRGGDPINAGSVIGPVGPVGPSGIEVVTSTTRPSSPYDGQHIYESDTFKDLIWNATKAGWFPPWNTMWGILSKQELTANSPSYHSSSNTDMVLSSVTLRNDRHYELCANFTAVLGALGAFWTFEFTVDGTQVGRIGQCSEDGLGEPSMGSTIYSPVTTGSKTIRVYAREVSGAEAVLLAASATVKRSLWVKDIGPEV